MALTPLSRLCVSRSWELQSGNMGAARNVGLNCFFFPFKKASVLLCDRRGLLLDLRLL